MNYYRIPIVERIIEFRKNGKKTKEIVIGGVGYKVICNKDDNPRELIEELKKKPTMIKVSNKFVYASSAEHALVIFYDVCTEASFGDEWDITVVSVDKRRPIVEIECPMITENSVGELICGQEVSIMPMKSGTFGFCVLGSKVSVQNCTVKEDILRIDIENPKVRRLIKVNDREYTVINLKEYLSKNFMKVEA
jgi:hypothetical protein